MCGRYATSFSWNALLDYYALHGIYSEHGHEPPAEFRADPAVVPTRVVPVIRRAPNGSQQIDFCCCGLLPAWSRGRTVRCSTINARDQDAAS